MRRRKNDRDESSEFTMPDACTTRVEVSHVLRAGYNRRNGKGASIVATDDKTPAFEIGMTMGGDLSR
jgi:hypothetical protein